MFFKLDQATHPIYLNFIDKTLEEQFMQYSYENDLFSFKLGISLGIAMFISFFLLDLLLHPHLILILSIIRFFVSLILILLLTYAFHPSLKNHIKRLQYLGITAAISVQFGLFLMGNQMGIHPLYLMSKTLLVLFFMYAIVGLAFKYTFLLGLLIGFSFQGFTIFIQSISYTVYVHQTIVLSCAMLVGIVAGYIIDKNKRWSFLKTLKIAQQNEQLKANTFKQIELWRDLHLKNQELEQFAYIISHDLKSPLRVIAGLTTIIERKDGNRLSDCSKADFQMIKDQVMQMSTMIQGVLAYSKVGCGELPIEQICIQSIIKDIQKTFSTEKEISWIVCNQIPIIFACRTMLIQLFQNLISNAIKYNDKEICEIKIVCQTADKYIRFYVIDNGPGIEEEYAYKIFKLFNTLQAKRKDSTGIGLAIVKKIIDRVQGNIYLDTTQLMGAKFVFQIPKDWNSL